jgi:prepilin-type N-terminal cleavage/methylation domain-containing protein
MKETSCQNGFTIIELIIAMAIMGVLFTVGYANFREYSQQKILEKAVLTIEGDIRLAQQLARSGKKIGTCDVLSSYQFTVTSNTSYQIDAKCNNGTFTERIETSVFLQTDTTINIPSTNPIDFYVLARGTNIPNSTPALITVTHPLTGRTKTISISSSGDTNLQ